MKTLSRIVLGALVALPLIAGALDFKTLEGPGVQRLYSARTSAVSSHTVSGYGLGWSAYASGGTADFVIKYSSVNGGDPSVNASSTVYILNGQQIGGEFKAMVANPIIRIERIDAATTIYIDIPYLAPRAPGAF